MSTISATLPHMRQAIEVPLYDWSFLFFWNIWSRSPDDEAFYDLNSRAIEAAENGNVSLANAILRINRVRLKSFG